VEENKIIKSFPAINPLPAFYTKKYVKELKTNSDRLYIKLTGNADRPE